MPASLTRAQVRAFSLPAARIVRPPLCLVPANIPTDEQRIVTDGGGRVKTENAPKGPFFRALTDSGEWGRTVFWRRRRDSNPRYAFGAYNGLANRRLQPLGHVSAPETSMESALARQPHARRDRERIRIPGAQKGAQWAVFAAGGLPPNVQDLQSRRQDCNRTTSPATAPQHGQPFCRDRAGGTQSGAASAAGFPSVPLPRSTPPARGRLAQIRPQYLR